MAKSKVEYGPAIRRGIPDGDESRKETALRMEQKMRDEVAQAALDHADGRLSKEAHDRKLRRAHFELNEYPDLKDC